MHAPEGRHVILDGWDADRKTLADAHALAEIVCCAAAAAGATVLNRFVQPFHPSGASIIVVLAESHATIHTYPEHGAYMADVFTCGDTDPARIAGVIAAATGGRFRVEKVSRGRK